eukprot:INCI4973.5.p2 GENE.INCI4973.5~~INCI4973.5.p2  ORF type:complete len:247 (+),score=61.54 INCI4973.5:297-1037(+)
MSAYGSEVTLLEVCIANTQSKRVLECFPPRAREDRFNFLVNNVKFAASGRNTFKHSLRSGEVDVYHCFVKDHIVYLCYTTPEAKLRVVYNFLAELDECYGNGQNGVDFLRSLMDKWNKPDADKVNAARVKVDQIKQVMIQNIQKALVRGAALSELEDRTNHLAESAQAFESSAKQLKCKFIKEKWKLIAIIVGVVVVIIICIVIGVVVGRKDSTDPTPAPSRRLLGLLEDMGVVQSSATANAVVLE